MAGSKPQNMGDWHLTESTESFLEWERDVGGMFGRNQKAVVWVEEHASGDGYIAWAQVEPEGGETHTIVPGSRPVTRSTAVSRAQRWMSDNPRWPRGTFSF